METNVKEAKETADATYKARRAEIQKQLDLLAGQLEVLDAQQAHAPRDWGFAGTAGHVFTELSDLTSMLGPS